MDTQRLAAILLIAGSAALALVTLLVPPGLYQTPDAEARVQILDEYKSRWNLFQAFNVLTLALTTAGFSLLALHLRTAANAWVPGLGAVAFVVGAVSAILFLYRQTTDTLAAYQGAYSSMETLYYWLALAGLVLFGVAFLQAGLSAWLGYLTAGAALVYGIVFLVSGGGFLTPWLVSFLGLIIAIFLLRQ